MTGPKRLGGCSFEIGNLVRKQKINAFFPLHNANVSYEILNKCMDYRTLPWNQPIEDIKKYFGESVALYNVFLAHYTEYLIYPSAIGVAFQIVVWATLNFSHPVLPFYACVITVWSIFMLEGWKRKEAFTSLYWGMSEFEEKQLDRPEFVGNLIPSFINGEDILYYPRKYIQYRVQRSLSIISLFIMLIIGVVASIYILRFAIQPSVGTYASIIASVINAMQIQIFNYIYQILVLKLTNGENQRTDTDYKDSVIVKLFLFQFVNSYASFFFLAFIASSLPPEKGTDPSYLGQCGYKNCMQPLGINLGIIFGSRLFITNLSNLLIPLYYVDAKYKTETKDFESKELSPAEVDYCLLAYDPIFTEVANYADTAGQYGYMVLFITALPIATFFSMVNSYFQLRIGQYVQTHVSL